ncbi:hypothetical protein BBJ28_00022475 [Nothophytophthora sp. Chile5]|nr:hypothetical protein BBJ28_00022475 [Nothophytophthora sp. Chile5]
MSSLLSSDVSTPRAVAIDETADDMTPPPLPTRAGLSSLMNSPLADDDADMEAEDADEAASISVVSASQGSEPGTSNVDDDVDMEDGGGASAGDKSEQSQTVGELGDPELDVLKMEFHAAIQQFLAGKADAAPSAKRQKKSKHARRARAQHATATAAANALGDAEVQRCVNVLHRKVRTQFLSAEVLSAVVRFCLAFCGVLDGQDPVKNLIVTATAAHKGVDLDATLARLSQKPLYNQLVEVVRRAVLSSSEATATELLTLILDWCLSQSSPSNWTWILAAIAQMNSYSLQDFLFREAIARYQFDSQSEEATGSVSLFLPVLAFLAAKHPAQMVDILRDLLEECASTAGGKAESVADTVTRLLALTSDSAALVKACDDNLQWVVTEELVSSLADKISSQDGKGEDANGNGSVKSHSTTVESQLLRFLRRRSAELSNSGFQLLLLLQNLSTTSSRSRLAASVTSFQQQLLDFAATEPSQAFIKGISRFLPFICQRTLRLLQSMPQDTEASESGPIQPDPPSEMHKEGPLRRFQEWKQWLCLLARAMSRKEVTDQLIEAELMLAEFNEVPLTQPSTTIQPADRALCELLTSILTPSSADYVEFVREMVQTCQSAAPRAKRRILAIVQTLLSLNEADSLVSETDARFVELSAAQDVSCVQQLAHITTWRDRQDAFALWKGVRGIDLWESLLDLAGSTDTVVASRALALVARTPFLSLEDPSWQYRCVRKLSVVFFSLLRQYRAVLVLQDGGKTSSGLAVAVDSGLPSRLQTLKLNLFRVLALDGGVARYPSSVYSVFASLWLDALLSTTSATSIPTHFPNGVNFQVDESGDLRDERVVIRCERTISSKCTNLQSSQVITKVPEKTLVYRKTLDSSWEREMHAARVCSVYATELFSQLVASTGTAATLLTTSVLSPIDEDEQCERRLKVVVDQLLERLIPCCGIPSDDTYKDSLPNRSSFDMDLRVEQWLNHFPAFLPLLRVVIATSTALGSSQLLRLVPVLKSALIVLLGHWNSVKGELGVENLDVPPYMRNQNQLAITCELMRLLRATNWLPSPLAKVAELLPLTTPADIRAILFSCWFYLADHPPRTDSRAPTPATSATASPISSGSSPAGFSITGLAMGGPSSSRQPLEFYLIPLRKALHRNIRKVGAKYPLFMC